MKIEKFWIVIKPNQDSELVDIFWKTDICEMQNQFLGGLRKEEIVGIYTEESEALFVAESLLENEK